MKQETVSGSGIRWGICKSAVQTDNHASTPPLSFLQAGCPSCRPTNSVKALKAHDNSNYKTNYPRSSQTDLLITFELSTFLSHQQQILIISPMSRSFCRAYGRDQQIYTHTDHITYVADGWRKVLHPNQHKTGHHLGDVLPSQSLGPVLKSNKTN